MPDEDARRVKSLKRKSVLRGAAAFAIAAPLMLRAHADADNALTFTSGEATLSYRIVGPGAPIVFLAGGPGFSAHYLDEVVPHLYGVSGIMLDQRGTGASTMPDAAQPITIADLVADIEALRTTLGFDALTIFGHSFGGFVAMAYASAHPTSVRGLLLVNSAPPDLSLEQKLDALRIARLTSDQRAALSALHAQPPGGAAENIRDQTRAMLPALFSDPQKATQFEPYLDSPEDYVPAVAAALEPDLAANGRVASLRDLHAPTLLAFGADDPGAALVVRALQAEFTAPQTALIAGAGHFPWIEQPKNFYNTVLNFLTANGLGGSNPL